MPASNTYEAIESITLTNNSSTVTFGSIPQTYTDLILIHTITAVSGGTMGIDLEFNSDSGTNYSATEILGNGSSASSTRTSNYNYINSGAGSSANQTNSIYHIMNYTNTTTYKTVLCHATDPAAFTRLVAGLWRSTAAITAVRIFHHSNTFASGSTFTLYGIKAA